MVPLKSWPGIGLVAVVTFALVAIGAVLSLGAFPAVVGILGWMLAVPVLAILTYFDEDEEEAEDAIDADADPMETLRARYARGELTESEFEHRVDRLLETEDVSSSRDRSTETERRERDPVRER